MLCNLLQHQQPQLRAPNASGRGGKRPAKGQFNQPPIPGDIGSMGGGPRRPGPGSGTGRGANSVAAGHGGQAPPGGPPLSDVGMGGGTVEDGNAWSMIARFVCNIPGCGASFSKKQNLQRHQSQKHGRQRQTGVRGQTGPDGEYGDQDEEYEDYM